MAYLITVSNLLLIFLLSVSGEVLFITKKINNKYKLTVIIHEEEAALYSSSILTCSHTSNYLNFEDFLKDEIIENFETEDAFLPEEWRKEKCLSKLVKFPNDDRCDEGSFAFINKSSYLIPIKEITVKDSVCIKVHTAMCDSCWMELSGMASDTKKTSIKMQELNLVWKDYLLYQEKVHPSSYALYVLTNCTEKNPFFALDNIRHCTYHDKLILQSTISSLDKLNCSFKKDPIYLDFRDVSKNNCPEKNLIGKNCSINVTQIFQDDLTLKDSIICNEETCYCPWGYKGPFCTERCMKFWGPNCERPCECDEICNYLDGTCDRKIQEVNAVINGTFMNITWEVFDGKNETQLFDFTIEIFLEETLQFRISIQLEGICRFFYEVPLGRIIPGGSFKVKVSLENSAFKEVVVQNPFRELSNIEITPIKHKDGNVSFSFNSDQGLWALVYTPPYIMNLDCKALETVDPINKTVCSERYNVITCNFKYNDTELEVKIVKINCYFGIIQYKELLVHFPVCSPTINSNTTSEYSENSSNCINNSLIIVYLIFIFIINLVQLKLYNCYL